MISDNQNSRNIGGYVTIQLLVRGDLDGDRSASEVGLETDEEHRTLDNSARTAGCVSASYNSYLPSGRRRRNGLAAVEDRGGGSEIENMARHFRKRPAALWLATQEVGEFLSIGHPFPHLVSDGDRAQPCQKWHGGRDKHHVSYQGIDSRFCITREGIAIP
jgi:hypothetical protein